MNAAIFNGPRDITLSERPDPTIQAATDAIVRVTPGLRLRLRPLVLAGHGLALRNVGLRGGVAPARKYIPELLADVLAGRINPGRLIDYGTDLGHIVDAQDAMDERRAIRSLVRVG